MHQAPEQPPPMGMECASRIRLLNVSPAHALAGQQPHWSGPRSRWFRIGGWGIVVVIRKACIPVRHPGINGDRESRAADSPADCWVTDQCNEVS